MRFDEVPISDFTHKITWLLCMGMDHLGFWPISSPKFLENSRQAAEVSFKPPERMHHQDEGSTQNSLVIPWYCGFCPPYLIHFCKLTLQWNVPIFNREYIFKRSIFHCHVSLPEDTCSILLVIFLVNVAIKSKIQPPRNMAITGGIGFIQAFQSRGWERGTKDQGGIYVRMLWCFFPCMKRMFFSFMYLVYLCHVYADLVFHIFTFIIIMVTMFLLLFLLWLLLFFLKGVYNVERNNKKRCQEKTLCPVVQGAVSSHWPLIEDSHYFWKIHNLGVVFFRKYTIHSSCRSGKITLYQRSSKLLCKTTEFWLQVL